MAILGGGWMRVGGRGSAGRLGGAGGPGGPGGLSTWATCMSTSSFLAKTSALGARFQLRLHASVYLSLYPGLFLTTHGLNKTKRFLCLCLRLRSANGDTCAAASCRPASQLCSFLPPSLPDPSHPTGACIITATTLERPSAPLDVTVSFTLQTYSPHIFSRYCPSCSSSSTT
jgi:hypothetical protein